MAKAVRPKVKRTLFRLIPRHGAFPVALAAGLVAFIAALSLTPKLAIGIGADTLFVVYLAIVAYEMPKLTPEFLKVYADEEDPPVAVIMLVTLGVVAISTFSLFDALNAGSGANAPQIAIGMISVVLGWFVVHTMAALHYAYEFYETPKPGPNGVHREKGDLVGGFEWPKGDKPNGVAFFYLSYQIGGALQIADVPSTSNKMRGLILVHTIFSFLYNTMLVTAAVNVVISAAGRG